MSGYIPFLRVSKLKDRELESVLTLIIKLLLESNLSLSVISKIIAELSSLLGQIQQAQNKNRASELTAQIRALDEQRGNQITSLFKGVDFYMTLTGTPMAEAAEVIDAVIEKYGIKIIHEGDKVSTVRIRTMIKELMEDDLIAATDTLSLTATVNAINTSNEKFDALYLQRATDDAEDTTPNLVPTRKLINERAYMLVYLFNFLYESEPETYAAVAGEMAEIIGDVMAVAKARETRNSHDNGTSSEEADVSAPESVEV